MPGTILLIAAFAALAPVDAGGRMTLADDSIRAEERAADPAPSEAPQAYLETRTVVFVGGFMNEIVRHRLAGNYFRQNTAAVRSVSPGTAVFRVFPPSSRAMSDNVEFLRERLADAWEQGGRRPLTVIGHSKGGAETLLTMLRHPELVLEGRVDDVVLIQSSIGGSPLSDCLSDPDACRPESMLMRLAGRWIRSTWPDGLLSLRTADADRVFGSAVTAARAHVGQGGLDRLSRSVVYVRTVAPGGVMSRRLRIVSDFLIAAGHDRNDGMLALEDQRLEGVGADLGEVLTASHTDLVCSGVGVSKRSRRFRAAFTRQLFMALAVRDSGVPSAASPTSRPPAAPAARGTHSPP